VTDHEVLKAIEATLEKMQAILDSPAQSFRAYRRQQDIAYLRTARWKIRLLWLIGPLWHVMEFESPRTAIKRIKARSAEIVAARLLRQWPYDKEGCP
jgi:hypothetical protein